MCVCVCVCVSSYRLAPIYIYIYIYVCMYGLFVCVCDCDSVFVIKARYDNHVKSHRNLNHPENYRLSIPPRPQEMHVLFGVNCVN